MRGLQRRFEAWQRHHGLERLPDPRHGRVQQPGGQDPGQTPMRRSNHPPHGQFGDTPRMGFVLDDGGGGRGDVRLHAGDHLDRQVGEAE